MVSVSTVEASSGGMVSFGPAGGQGNGGVWNGSVSVSATSKYVSFISNATDLVSGDTAFKDVFVLDTETGTVTKESGVGVSGMPTTGHVDRAAMSRNGRFVVSNSTIKNGKLYLRDRTLQQTIQINTSYSQVPHPLAISEDGRFVFYNRGGLYYYDLSSSTETLIHTYAANSTISCDGRFVAFNTGAQLLGTDTNSHEDVYLADLMGGISFKLLTTTANDRSTNPVISCDGNHVVFTTKADNLGSGDTNSNEDVYQYSVSDLTFKRVSLAPDGSEYQDSQSSAGGVNGSYANVSIDGRYVTFGVTKAEPYIYGGWGTVSNDIYVRDTKNDTTVLAFAGLHGVPRLGYDFKKMYFVGNLNAGQGKLYFAANYL
ncbi:MAG: hypothetical protein WBP26_00935 [Candidatus Saccharimonadales bacterium]